VNWCIASSVHVMSAVRPAVGAEVGGAEVDGGVEVGLEVEVAMVDGAAVVVATVGVDVGLIVVGALVGADVVGASVIFTQTGIVSFESRSSQAPPSGKIYTRRT